MLKVDQLVQFHERALRTPGWPAAAADAGSVSEDPVLSAAIVRNHQCNAGLWREEDQARRRDVPADHIVISKRRIDALNQQRNDAVEQIDDVLLSLLASRPPQAGARLHSETPGAMIDRLSILSLKIFHMGLQRDRDDVEAVHIARCGEKLHRLRVQRRDLAGCLKSLLDELRTGRACFHAYRQFKMYNDPALCPWLNAQATMPPDPSRNGV